MMNKKTLTMTALACTFVLGSWAQNPEPQSPQVKYIERSWDDSQKQIVETEKTLNGADYTMLSGSDDWVRLGVPETENPTEEQINKDYYYVVAGIVTYKVLNVYGRVHLILCNNAQLTCTGSVLVEDGHNNAKLFIYGQKDVEGQNPGKLIVNNTEYNSTAGIGSSEEQKCGEITIHGGYLDVKGSKWAAGIGGGGFRLESSFSRYDTYQAEDGTTIIYGGTVKAQGGELGSGIGAGGRAKGGILKIYGGDVTATGGELAAGVGGGGSYQRWTSNTNGLRGGLGSNVYVYGGKLTAQGGQYAAGIGTGCIADGEDTQNKVPETDRGELYVYEGATVIATGGNWGAGIGGGWKANGIKTWIYGGNVTAKGGEDAAGIGSGENTKYSEEYEWRAARGGETHISGGVVWAEGTSYSAGIGGGEYGFGGKTYITGGTVTVVAGEDCECRNNGGGCAIGCGQGIGDDGNNKDTERNAGILEIGDNMKVTGGDAENNIEAFSTAVRVPACIWRNYVKIEPCTHTVPDDGTTTDVYIYIDEGSHYRYCRYCKNIITEEHTAGECPCGSTGYSFTTYVPVANPTTAGTGYQEVRAYRLKAGKYFFLPECDVIPTGYKFLGWEMNPNPESASYDKWAAVKGGDPSGDDKIAAGTSVQALEGMDNAKFYARYLYDFNDEWTWGEGNTSGSLKISCEVLDDIYVQFQESDITKQYLDDGIEYSISYTYTLNGYNYIFSTQKTAPYKLTLQDAADNNTAIGQYNGKTATATLAGRTLYRDGKWNTLCLPFAVSLDAKNSPLSGDDVEAMVLRSSDSGLNGTTLTLNFEAVSPSGEQGGLIPAGTPFIIKWGTVDSHPDTDLTDPVFQDVTVSDATNDVSFTGGAFKGTYKKLEYTTEKKSILFLGDDNTLYYPQPSGGNNPSIGACRAYFELSGTGAREFKLYFGDVGSADDSSASGIAVVSSATDADGDVRAPRWYDLQGRQIVNSKFVNRKLFKGLYINNGKKVVIK